VAGNPLILRTTDTSTVTYNRRTPGLAFAWILYGRSRSVPATGWAENQWVLAGNSCAASGPHDRRDRVQVKNEMRPPGIASTADPPPKSPASSASAARPSTLRRPPSTGGPPGPAARARARLSGITAVRARRRRAESMAACVRSTPQPVVPLCSPMYCREQRQRGVAVPADRSGPWANMLGGGRRLGPGTQRACETFGGTVAPARGLFAFRGQGGGSR
jgi:hypothetical protein